MIPALKKIGLTEAEIKVYEAIISLGQSTISKIHEMSGVERRYIYDILEKLIKKGLVSYTKEKGKKNFQITHPNKIISYIEEQENELNKTKKEIEKYLPEIIEKFKETRPAIKTEIYRGKEGFKSVGEDMLNYKEVWIIGGSGEVEKHLPAFWKSYNKRRIKNKVMWHDLIKDNTLMQPFKNKQQESLKKQYYEYRILPEEVQGPNIISIYGDKVVNMLWEDEMFAFAIQNKRIAESYKQYFNFLWKISRK